MKRQPLLIVAMAFAIMLAGFVAPAQAGPWRFGNLGNGRKTTTTTTTAPTTTSTTTSTSTTSTTTTSTTTTSTTTPPNPGQPPLPVTTRRLTKLRFTIDSTSDWANVDLLGGSLYSQTPPTVVGGNGYPYSTTGFAVQTAGYVKVIVDAVYELPASGNLDLRICKNNDGITAAKIERITDTPTTVVDYSNSRVDAVWVDGCADPSHTAVAADALAAPYAWPRPVDDRRLTLGIYSPWYTPASFTNPPHLVDAAVAPYDCSTTAGVAGMVNEAADNGMNGFVFWYNGEAEAERRYDLLMSAAEARPGFVVAGELDLGAAGGFATGSVTEPAVEAYARTLLARATSPSYLRVGGRPVLFVWGTPYMSLPVWQQVRQALQASGLNPFVVADSMNMSFGFDGFWVLNPNNVPDAGQLPSWFEYWARSARFTPERSLGSAPTLWAAGISPGEDDTYAGKPAGTGMYVPRNGGARYDAVWQAAAMTNPEWMIISSWNDFHEATYIQPSVGTGTTALSQTRAWGNWFGQP